MSFVTTLSDDVEQFMFERGEYDFPEDDTIRWINKTQRNSTVENIYNALISNQVEPLKNYFKDQLAEMSDEDELIPEAKRILNALNPFTDYVPKDTDDIFYLFEDGRIHWVYYNPDSVSEGQYVLLIFTTEDIIDASNATNNMDDFFDYLQEYAKEYLIDRGTEDFESYEHSRETPDIVGFNGEVYEKLLDLIRE